MPDKQYHFDEERLIIAYNHNEFAGIFVTYPNESFTKRELLNFFEGTNPTYLIAAKLPNIDGINPYDTHSIEDFNNYHSKLSHLIEKLCVNDQTGLDVEFYIPRTLH